MPDVDELEAAPVTTVAGPLPLLDADGVAALLGISRRTVEKWVAERRIPFVKLGDTGAGGRGVLVRFRPESLDEWIRSKEVPPHE